MELRKNIAIISVYPPPFGGVAIHAKILAEELVARDMLILLICKGKKNVNENSYIKRISNGQIFNKNIFWYYKILFLGSLYSKDVKIIHSHEGLFIVPFLFIHRFIFRKKIIFTIHNQWVKEQYNQLNLLPKLFTKLFFKDKHTFWICVNDNAYNQMLELGAKKDCISVIPAYIPHTTSKVVTQNDIKIKQTIENFKKDNKLIGVYGFRISYDSLDRDIYGLNFSIDVFKQLIKTMPLVMLVILIPDATPLEKKEDLLLKIKNEGLDEKILTLFDNPIINMNILWDQLEIYFRPTTDDGDSLAVREALAAGVKVVASNVCKRPKGTIIFNSLDVNGATKCLIEAINGFEKCEIDNENYLKKILDIYTKCIH